MKIIKQGVDPKKPLSLSEAFRLTCHNCLTEIEVSDGEMNRLALPEPKHSFVNGPDTYKDYYYFVCPCCKINIVDNDYKRTAIRESVEYKIRRVLKERENEINNTTTTR